MTRGCGPELHALGTDAAAPPVGCPRMPGCACARSPAGSRCRPFPQRSHGHARPDHRRGDGPLHPWRCGANASVAAWVIVRPMAYVPPCPRAGIGRQPVTRCSDRRCGSSSRIHACAWPLHSARAISCCGPWQTSTGVPSRGAEAMLRNFANRTIRPIYRI